MTRRMAFVLVTVTALLATAALAVAGDGKEQIRFNRADQAAARAVVLRRTDLGSSAPALLGSGRVAIAGKDGVLRVLALSRLDGHPRGSR